LLLPAPLPAPPTPSPPPAMLAAWLAAPSSTPAHPELSIALWGRPRGEASVERSGHYLKYLLAPAALCLAAAYLLVLAGRLGRALLRACLPQTRSTPTCRPTPRHTAVPSEPAVASPAGSPGQEPLATPSAPSTAMSYNAFRTSLRGRGFSRAEVSQLWREQKAAHFGTTAPTATTGDAHAARAARPARTAMTPRRLDLAADVAPPRSGWNALQRLAGGKGFTKEQMSLMWSAHKQGVSSGSPLSYHQFRTHCKGRGFTRSNVSAMWAQHKLFSLKGVTCAPRATLGMPPTDLAM